MYMRLHGGLLLMLTTPADKNVCWRLPTKAVTSWTAVGKEHEQRSWTHDQRMFCKRHWFLLDKKVWYFQRKEYLQKRLFFHGDILTWRQIIFLILFEATCFFNTSSSCALTNLRIFKIETFLIRKFAKNWREVSKSWEILLWLRLGEDKDLSRQGILTEGKALYCWPPH
jgi:hypothetical protein